MSAKSFASFYVEDQLFGVDILMVREINRQLDISAVPNSPDYVRGLVNLRGQIVTIVDLNRRLGLPPACIGPESHNIILKTEGELVGLREREGRNDLHSAADKVGLLVDSIGDVIALTDEEIDPPPANIGELEGRYLTGVAKLSGEIMAILDVHKVLTEGKD
jgi:purine-binding chemotaxis protein CheW